MTSEEFIELVSKHWYIKNDEVSYNWTIGGMSGGNCWGDSPKYSITADDEPENPIDNLLLEIAPNVSYLQYKKIIRAMSTRDYTDDDYYGNYYEKRERYIHVKDLYDLLRSMNLI